jgi:hypothetical protein
MSTSTPAEALPAVRRWWSSRLGAPFARELVLVTVLLLAYKYGRYSVRDSANVAFEHARELVHVERALRIFSEARVQDVVLSLGDSVARALNSYYLVAHVVVTAAAFLWLFVAHPGTYRRFRRVMLTMTIAALALHLLFPLAPPRMLPHLGFVDTGARVGPAAYGQGSTYGSFANEFAAMPSLHFGWAVAVAWATALATRGRWRFLAIGHPVLTLAAVVATANHYWLDAGAAGMLFVFALAIDRQRETHAARDEPQPGAVASSEARIGAGMGVESRVPGATDT